MFTYFSSLNDEIDQNTNFEKLPSGKMAFFDKNVSFITQKLKRKYLPISVFSGQRFFWGNERKHFSRSLGLRVLWTTKWFALKKLTNYLFSNGFYSLIVDSSKLLKLYNIMYIPFLFIFLFLFVCFPVINNI